MNNRIRELVRQAGLDDPNFQIEDWDNVPLAYFAELVIRECLKQVRDEVQYLADWDKADEVINSVKKHFGVSNE
jgi:hypothetical protein